MSGIELLASHRMYPTPALPSLGREQDRAPTNGSLPDPGRVRVGCFCDPIRPTISYGHNL